MEKQITISVRYCWYNLFRDVQFVQELFDTLINYNNRVIVRFENTSQEFYFYMKIFHTGTNFETRKELCEVNISCRYQKENYCN